MRKNKAQIKIQETAFVLVALVLLFAIAFVFYFRFSYTGMEKKAAELQQKEALSRLDKIIGMPELRCSSSLGSATESLCIDEDKLIALLELKEEYKKIWRGLKEVKIKKVFPDSDKEFIIFSKGEGNLTYSAFTSLCKEMYDGVGWYKCTLGMILISI